MSVLGFDLSLFESSICLFRKENDFELRDLNWDRRDRKLRELSPLERDAFLIRSVSDWSKRSAEELKPNWTAIEEIKMRPLQIKNVSKRTGKQLKDKPIIPSSLTQLAGLKWVTILKLQDLGYLPVMITASEARSAYFGKGKIKKDQVFRRLKEKFPELITNHNRADAYLVAWRFDLFLRTQKEEEEDI